MFLVDPYCGTIPTTIWEVISSIFYIFRFANDTLGLTL